MTEAYQPTRDEYVRTRRPSEELKLSGDGVFATLQGEGVSAGRPSVFIRLQNCNLHCGQDDQGWQCDAWYTWDTAKPEYWQETRLVDMNVLADEITTAWQSNFAGSSTGPSLVMTGGEPLLQQRKLARLLPLLPDWHTEIETNGTIVPLDNFKNTQINCSPKLATSGNELRARRRTQALRAIARFPDYWFKFVVSDPASDRPEIEQLVELANGGDFSRVLLMSEGVVARDLIEKEAQLNDLAQQLGCMVTARNHIFWFGDKRAT